MIEGEHKTQLTEELRYGPKKRRQCTDLLFCLVFAVFSVVNLVVVVQCLKRGDISKIAQPYDYDGRCW